MREAKRRGNLLFIALIGDLRSNPVRGRETGTNEPASSYLVSKARMSLAEKQMEKMKNKGKTSELLGQLTDLLRRGDKASDDQ
ncbi:MAG: hypothetical protein AAGU03_01825 [Anaerolineaceae bacterium]